MGFFDSKSDFEKGQSAANGDKGSVFSEFAGGLGNFAASDEFKAGYKSVMNDPHNPGDSARKNASEESHGTSEEAQESSYGRYDDDDSDSGFGSDVSSSVRSQAPAQDGGMGLFGFLGLVFTVLFVTDLLDGRKK